MLPPRLRTGISVRARKAASGNASHFGWLKGLHAGKKSNRSTGPGGRSVLTVSGESRAALTGQDTLGWPER